MINKKLITLYKDKDKKIIYTKDKSTIITKDVLGKVFFVYNGIKWIEVRINHFSYINKPIGMLRKVVTKQVSVYKKKKNKKKNKKNKKKK